MLEKPANRASWPTSRASGTGGACANPAILLPSPCSRFNANPSCPSGRLNTETVSSSPLGVARETAQANANGAGWIPVFIPHSTVDAECLQRVVAEKCIDTGIIADQQTAIGTQEQPSDACAHRGVTIELTEIDRSLERAIGVEPQQLWPAVRGFEAIVVPIVVGAEACCKQTSVGHDGERSRAVEGTRIVWVYKIVAEQSPVPKGRDCSSLRIHCEDGHVDPAVPCGRTAEVHATVRCARNGLHEVGKNSEFMMRDAGNAKVRIGVPFAVEATQLTCPQVYPVTWEATNSDPSGSLRPMASLLSATTVRPF